MPNDAFVQSVRRRLPDDAHIKMFDDALAALAGDNRQRVQHFAVTMRELFGHVLSSRVSDDDVRRCVSYKQEQGTRGPTRRQRALYLSRGGLSDDFIRDTLKLNPDEFHQELKDAFDELSAKTHVRPNSAPTDPAKIERTLSAGSSSTKSTRTDRIRALNDELRKNFSQGHAVMTIGIAALGTEAVTRIVKTIEVYDKFCLANDPHEEHDFGSFEIDGRTIFFKIDYFDKDLTYHSLDPSDPSITERVITIMLAEEY